MSPIQNLAHDPTTPRSGDHPPRSDAAGSRPPTPIEVAAGIGLLALWAVSGFLFDLAFVEVVLLGALLWPRPDPGSAPAPADAARS